MIFSEVDLPKDKVYYVEDFPIFVHLLENGYYAFYNLSTKESLREKFNTLDIMYDEKNQNYAKGIASVMGVTMHL